MARKTNLNINGSEYFKTTLFLGYDANGKRVQKQFYGKSKKEAEQKKYEYLESDTNGILLKKDDTVGKIMYEWLFNIVIIEVKPSSFERYEGFYRNYVANTHFSRLHISKVTSNDLQLLFNNLYTTKGSAHLVKSFYNFINKFFNYQVKINTIKTNYCSKVVLPKNQEVQKEIEIFTLEEIEIFKNAIDENFDYFIFYFALATGMRQGEIIALTLDDIDFVNGSININKTTNKVNIYEDGKKTRKLMTYPPKSTNSIRKIPIPAQLEPFLIKQVDLQKANKSNLLFTNQLGNVYDADKLYEKYKRFLKRHEIKHRKFHTLRHTYCSILARNNVPLKIAAELMGHDVEMTSKIYTHINLDDKKNAIRLISF